MKISDCNNHVKTAIDFFGPSCAINSLLDKYNPMGNKFLCLLGYEKYLYNLYFKLYILYGYITTINYNSSYSK